MVVAGTIKHQDADMKMKAVHLARTIKYFKAFALFGRSIAITRRTSLNIKLLAAVVTERAKNALVSP